MDQRPPPCAHRAPRLPVPSTTTSTAHASLHTAPWPHHQMPLIDQSYRLRQGWPCQITDRPVQLDIIVLHTRCCWRSRKWGWPHQIMWLDSGQERVMMGSTHIGLICHTFHTPILDLRHVDLTVRHKMIGFHCHSRERGECRLRGWDTFCHWERARALRLGGARLRLRGRPRCHFLGRVRGQIWGRARCPLRGTLWCWVPISWPPIAPRIWFQMTISILPRGKGLARSMQATQRIQTDQIRLMSKYIFIHHWNP